MTFYYSTINNGEQVQHVVEGQPIKTLLNKSKWRKNQDFRCIVLPTRSRAVGPN